MKKLKYNIKIKKIDNNFQMKDLLKKELPVYDIKYNQKKPFENLSSNFSCYSNNVSYSLSINSVSLLTLFLEILFFIKFA